MYRYLLAAFVAPALLFVSSGCGGGDETASSDQSAILASLIHIGDLPAKAKEVDSPPPSPCDPLMVFAAEKSEFAKSSMFAIGQTRVQEAVGQFASAGAAARAYDALNAKSRLACIRETIALQRGLSIKVHSPRNLNVGDEAEAILFEVHRLGSGQRSSVEVASVKSEQSVASLIFLDQAGESDTTLVGDVVAAATGLLARGSEG
jgi:hypothetical protein